MNSLVCHDRFTMKGCHHEEALLSTGFKAADIVLICLAIVTCWLIPVTDSAIASSSV